MANVTYEQFKRRQELQEQHRDEREWPPMLDESNPDHWIYPMPTVAEVVAAGYASHYHETVARERAELVRRFLEDAGWRESSIKNMREARAAAR